jgi:hypothetical protein
MCRESQLKVFISISFTTTCFDPTRHPQVEYALAITQGLSCYNGAVVLVIFVAVYVCGANTILLLFYIFIIMLKL